MLHELYDNLGGREATRKMERGYNPHTLDREVLYSFTTVLWSVTHLWLFPETSLDYTREQKLMLFCQNLTLNDTSRMLCAMLCDI